MRTRTRTIDQRVLPFVAGFTETGGAETHYCNGTPTSYANAVFGDIAPLVVQGFEERMDDNLGVGQPHSVIHRKRSFVVNEGVVEHGGTLSSTSYAHWAGYGAYRAYNMPHRKYQLDQNAFNINSKVSVPSRWSINGTINESALIENCFEKARELKADVLLNLVEGHQLWPSIKSLATTLPDIGRNWGRIRKVVKHASGGFLAWKFGVSPVLSDVMAINRFLPKLGKSIAAARRGDRKRFSSVGNYTVVCDTTPSDISVENGYTVNGISYQGRVLVNPAVRYVLVVEPNRRYETEFFSALDTCMSRFATSPASLAWEKVPFSFVADWFVDLRGALRALDNMIGFEPFKIVSFTRSYSYRMATDVFWTRRTPCSGSEIFDVPCGSVEFSHYERTLASVGATAPTWKPRFGKNQAGISAALIGQSLSKVNSRKP